MIRLFDAPIDMQHVIHAIPADSQISIAIFWWNFKLDIGFLNPLHMTITREVNKLKEKIELYINNII